MSWVGRRERKCLFVLDLPVMGTQACLEQAANVDTAVLGDFGVAEYAICIVCGSRLLQ